MGLYLVPSLENVPLSPHFAQFADFISMYLVVCLCFLTLEKWPFAGDILYVPPAHSPLVPRAMCFRGTPYFGCMGPSVVQDCYRSDVFILVHLMRRHIGSICLILGGVNVDHLVIGDVCLVVDYIS